MVRPHDVDKNYEMNDDDRVIIGNRRPNVTAGWSNIATYKGFELSFQLYGRFGYWVHRNASLYGYGTLGEAIDYWTPDNPSNEWPRPSFNSLTTYQSALAITDASYIRLRTLAIGYTLPKKLIARLGIENLRIYASGENLCFWSARKGLDPRYSYNENTQVNVYSPVRTIMGGLQLTF